MSLTRNVAALGVIVAVGWTAISATPTPLAPERPLPWILELPREEPTGPITGEDDPRWDCTTMGNRICGVVFGYAA